MNGTLPNIFSVDDIKIIQLIYFPEERGNLVVMENYKSCPFAISRAFSVRAPINMIRGQHAHKDCAQFLVCLNGEVEVTCDDGIEKKLFLLDSPKKGLYIPKSIWQIQKYIKKDSVLLFLCDQPYDVNEYINNYDDFLSYRSIK